MVDWKDKHWDIKMVDYWVQHQVGQKDEWLDS